MQQPVHFARTSDGVTIAYAAGGAGHPLLMVPGWLSHLEMDMEEPDHATFVQTLGQGGRRRVIRFDMRGTGLSDREAPDLSVTARAADIEAVIDHMGLESTAIFAWSMGGPPAVVYAATHPEKVSHLVLYGSFSHPHETGREAVGKALVDLIRADWRIGSKAIVEFVHPNAEKDVADAFSHYARAAASGAVAASILEEALFQVDVREYLPKLTMPTLVLHRRDDQAFPMACGRDLASLIPHAHFVPLPGNVHAPHYGNSAPILDAINEFLATRDGHTHGEEQLHEHEARGEAPAGLQIILFTDMESSTSLTQQLGDAHAQELVRAHNNIVRDALRENGGSEIKHTGDGIMATFPSAARAIDCAVTIQRGCDTHAVEHPTAPLRMRIGINAGEPVAEERDIFGAAVQLAARVCSSAGPGQILVSDVVRQLAAGKRFLWSDQGHVALRGFEDPVRLYEVKWRS
ncbi:MAG TPA: adenylate/guanylate cyclase domain-containing protein [Dehalococcoidia bacterium]|jgi:class 3 adenylate cyclase|nr:adenylate/guanylate cyclase domain-containing protein [Dehalococcoidia bacterium]